jgi:hypothetical protein
MVVIRAEDKCMTGNYRFREQNRVVWRFLAIALVFSLVLCPSMIVGCSSSGSSGGSNVGSSTQKFNQPEKPLPSNGDVGTFTDAERVAPLSIKTSSGDSYYYYVLLKTVSGSKVISVFIYPGRTVDVDVPLGAYYLYYAVGEKWYGTSYLFGPDTIYSQADEVFDFYETSQGVNGYSVELILQTGGNLSTSQADASDFR